MKTPEEIKKGLSCCCQTVMDSCDECPYIYIDGIDCANKVKRDALELIKQYEERLKVN